MTARHDDGSIVSPTDPRQCVRDLGSILGVWAHPDDECYLSAGLMAMAADLACPAVCVTATRGERGTPDPEEWPPERLAPLREAELAASLEILGVRDHHWLGHRDGEVHEVDDNVGVAQLAELIASVRPDTVVTFGPDGMTGHGDHVTVGRWATAAAGSAENRPRVLHAAVNANLYGSLAHHFDRLPVYGPDGPPLAGRDVAALTLDLPEDVLNRKIAALKAQDSQTRPVVESMGEPAYRQWCSIEVFVES